MNAYEIARLLEKLGVRETKAETYPNTYSLVNGASFLAQQVSNRDSASWKKAEYIILTDTQVSQGILEGWKKLTERDPLPSAIQKLCVPASQNQFDVYDSQGKLIESNSLDRIIKHTPDIVDILNKKNPLINTTYSQNDLSFTPSQIIYYGVPGCGKSHTITTMLKDEKVKDPTFSEENQVVRTTFHPEYTNADFIGQILPEVHEDSQGKSVVEYKFKPGPFAKILKQALHNPSRPFYLVIEEINRGNAAAIFGDVFQLLDRLKNGDTSKEPVGTDGFENHYGKGWSEYFVMNADVNAYIRDAKSDDELDTKSIDVSGIHFSSSTGLRLPPNLSIYATMNTSDQNVFTLDNAFQRRWDMELVPNTCNWNDEDHKNQAQLPIGDTDIRWETFRKAINGEISDGDFFNADDKQLGLFFIEAEGDKIDGKKFANKVLKYLWADVFKRDTGKIFKSENLSKVVEDFTGTDAFDKVFVEDFVQSLKNANEEIKNHE